MVDYGTRVKASRGFHRTRVFQALRRSIKAHHRLPQLPPIDLVRNSCITVLNWALLRPRDWDAPLVMEGIDLVCGIKDFSASLQDAGLIRVVDGGVKFVLNHCEPIAARQDS